MAVTYRDPRTLDLFEARPDPGDATDDGGPAALVDLLVCELHRRVLLVCGVVRQLPDNGAAAAGAIAQLNAQGRVVAELAAEKTTRPSALVDACRKLHRRLSVVEELAWTGLYRAVRGAEERGEIE